MQDQLELRDSQIHELKRLYKESRDAETRHADLVQQLRLELAQNNPGMITTDLADQQNMIQRENRELRDRVDQLESRLRFVSPSCVKFY